MSTADHFESFLEQTVNLKPWKLTKLDERVASIIAALEKDEVVGEMYLGYTKQGSWAHRTIIDPVGDYDEFDADFLLRLTVNPAWDDEDRGRYLREVRAAFKRHAVYSSMVEKKNRCVRIKYANSCHVDVVPHLVIEDENGEDRQVIINYKDNVFEETNPEGLTAWMAERDALTNGHFRDAVRLMKYLRDFKNTFDCKSVILTTLMGGTVQPANAATRYADVPTTFTSILADLDAYLAPLARMPLIDDPSCPGTDFNHRWDEDKFMNFKAYVSKYSEWAREASEAEDEDSVIRAWQRMFGDKFVAAEVREGARLAKQRRISASTVRPRTDLAPDEEFIEDRNYAFSPRYSAVIVGQARRPGWVRWRPIRKSRNLPRGMELRFTVKSPAFDSHAQVDVLWKVRNHGEAAEARSDLRGQLFRSETGVPSRHKETTKYQGHHWIQVYLVIDGVVVASDHHDVSIT